MSSSGVQQQQQRQQYEQHRLSGTTIRFDNARTHESPTHAVWTEKDSTCFCLATRDESLFVNVCDDGIDRKNRGERDAT